MSCERELPSRSGGLIYAFQNVMDKTEADAWDVKRFEKLFKKQLNELEIENEMLQIKLKNKIKEMNQLRMQFRDKEEHCDRLERDKLNLERHLDIEVMKSYRLDHEVDDLKLAKKKLQIEFDYLLLQRDN